MTTLIRLSDERHRALSVYKSKHGLTHDEAIARLLEEAGAEPAIATENGTED